MKKAFILFISIFLLVSGNILGQSKKELKKQKQQEEYQVTKKLIESGNFIFEADWAITQKGRRINLSAEGYFLKIEGKSTSALLPFFGQTHSPSLGGGGIEFETLSTEIEIEYNDKKNKIQLKFNAQEKSENFSVFLTVFSSGNSNLRISSSSRNSMSYDGKIKELPAKKED